MVSHELCHTLGMKHCYYFQCAMNDSSSIEEAAAQPLFLCPICLRKLKKVLKFDIFQRYERLRESVGKLLEASSSLEEEREGADSALVSEGHVTCELTSLEGGKERECAVDAIMSPTHHCVPPGHSQQTTEFANSETSSFGHNTHAGENKERECAVDAIRPPTHGVPPGHSQQTVAFANSESSSFRHNTHTGGNTTTRSSGSGSGVASEALSQTSLVQESPPVSPDSNLVRLQQALLWLKDVEKAYCTYPGTVQ